MSNYPFEAHENVSNNRSGIYAIVNLANNKLYIGSAIKLSARQSSHLSNLNSGKHRNRHLQSSFNKYGKDYFIFKVVEYCERNELIEREQFWINQFDFDTQLYNLNPTAGSQLGYKHSEESRKKMSESRKSVVDKCKIQPNCKRVQQIDKVTKEVIATFNSVNEAASCVDGYASNISTVCLGKRKSTYQYIWAFEEL